MGISAYLPSTSSVSWLKTRQPDIHVLLPARAPRPAPTRACQPTSAGEIYHLTAELRMAISKLTRVRREGFSKSSASVFPESAVVQPMDLSSTASARSSFRSVLERSIWIESPSSA